MNPPSGDDPNGFTQPMPAVEPPPPRPGPGAPRAAYVHRFWSLPIDLVGRFGGLLIDLPGVAFVLCTFAFASYSRGSTTFAVRDVAGFEALAAASFAIALVFAYLCEALTGGTLGKLVFGVHVRRVDGGHAGGGRVLVRYLLIPIDLVIVGALLIAVTRRRQRVGDLLAGTVVSRSPLGLGAPVLGLVAVLAIGYGQITYGGGATSAFDVATETANVAPAAIAQLRMTFGIEKSPGVTPSSAIQPSPAPGDASSTP